MGPGDSPGSSSTSSGTSIRSALPASARRHVARTPSWGSPRVSSGACAHVTAAPAALAVDAPVPGAMCGLRDGRFVDGRPGEALHPSGSRVGENTLRRCLCPSSIFRLAGGRVACDSALRIPRSPPRIGTRQRQCEDDGRGRSTNTSLIVARPPGRDRRQRTCDHPARCQALTRWARSGTVVTTVADPATTGYHAATTMAYWPRGRFRRTRLGVRPATASGRPPGARTLNQRIKSPLLYQLS